MGNNERITFMDAILFSLVLEVTLLQLKVLELSSSLQARQECRNKDEQHKRDKLKRDRDMIKEVIRRTLLEILEGGRWDSLRKASISLEKRTKCLSNVKLSNEKLKMITFMDAILFSLVLEVTLLQLKVLELSSSLQARQECRNKDEQHKRDKLKRDRDMIKEVIRRTLLEILEGGRWDSLRKASISLEKRTKCLSNVKLSNEKLKISLTDITEDIKTNKTKWSTGLYEASQQIAFLQDKIKDDGLNARIRLRYAEKWVATRQESLVLHQTPKIEPPPNTDHENRVHKELLHAYELQIQAREQSLEHWRKRYLDDTAKMDERLASRREDFRKSVARRDELQKLYDLHEGEMRAWLTFKKERAARLAREERLRKAATCIQAWWRGVMVRRALGSFKYLKNAKKTPSKIKKK